MPVEKRRLPRVTELAHDLIRRFVNPGDRVIDATLGNGHDAVFLADLVGPDGRVYGFDIQQSAIASAKERLGGRENVELFRTSHENLSSHVREHVRAVMFNLGYLPSGDKTIITRASSTIDALKHAFGQISVPGLITIVVYPGHDGGEDEAAAVEEWVDSLPAETIVCSRSTTGRPEDRFPYLIAIEKRRQNVLSS